MPTPFGLPSLLHPAGPSSSDLRKPGGLSAVARVARVPRVPRLRRRTGSSSDYFLARASGAHQTAVGCGGAGPVGGRGPEHAHLGRPAQPAVGKWRRQNVQTRQQPVQTEVRSPFPLSVSLVSADAKASKEKNRSALPPRSPPLAQTCLYLQVHSERQLLATCFESMKTEQGAVRGRVTLQVYTGRRGFPGTPQSLGKTDPPAFPD